MGDGWVLSEGLFQGTHAVTDRSIMLRAGFLRRLDADGLQTQEAVYFDYMTMMVQLGLVDPGTSVLPTTWGQVKSLFE